MNWALFKKVPTRNRKSHRLAGVPQAGPRLSEKISEPKPLGGHEIYLHRTHLQICQILSKLVFKEQEEEE